MANLIGTIIVISLLILFSMAIHIIVIGFGKWNGFFACLFVDLLVLGSYLMSL